MDRDWWRFFYTTKNKRTPVRKELFEQNGAADADVCVFVIGIRPKDECPPSNLGPDEKRRVYIQGESPVRHTSPLLMIGGNKIFPETFIMSDIENATVFWGGKLVLFVHLRRKFISWQISCWNGTYKSCRLRPEIVFQARKTDELLDSLLILRSGITVHREIVSICPSVARSCVPVLYQFARLVSSMLLLAMNI